MFLNHPAITPDLDAGLLDAAMAAARAIPPAFPLEATVAVNPFLGQAAEDLPTAQARLSRVAGIALTQPRAALAAQVAAQRISDDDLACALLASPHPLKPVDLAMLKARMHAPAPAPRALPTVADLAATRTGIDWPALIARCLGLWAAGRFDQGQALWTPAPGLDCFRAWRDWAVHDLTPEIAGLRGFCAHVAASPDTAERAILAALHDLSLTPEGATTACHRLLIDLGGWAQHARYLAWQAQMAGGQDRTLTDLLAIRLIWDQALLARHPELSAEWQAIARAHAEPVEPTADDVLDAILQDAAERAHLRRLTAGLSPAAPAPARPAVQAAFCIDVRSEVLRRALESQGPGIETIGFAGFFGLPVAHHGPASTLAEAHLPVLLNAGLTASSQGTPEVEETARIAARATRAWGRFRQAAVSSFAFIEAAGPLYGAKLLKGALGQGHAAKPEPRPVLSPDPGPQARADLAAGILRAMGLTQGFARLVLLVGHGAQVTNNPHASAYHCGACGGRSGAVSARLLAGLLNMADTRAGLAERGLPIPEDTVFVAGLHDTTTDRVTLFADDPAPGHADDLDRARHWLDQAGALARAERSPRLPGARPASVAARARDWAETRPEWGLAGCAAFIAAPRSVTRGLDLQGRAFLHSYDRARDPDHGVLELILTAPVVVASWISLQYYGSTLAPQVFGGGDKLIHNVTGGIGVVEGNGGTLRAGLPWQAVHDGTRPVHDALRLSVLIDADPAAMGAILARHAELRALFDNGWLSLTALEGPRVVARYRPGGEWR